MSQQLSHELYKWLSSLQVLPQNLRYKPNGNFQLDPRSRDGILSGFLIGDLIVKLASQFGASLNNPLLASIKNSNTPAARTYNWNILSDSFLKLNVTVSKQTQKEIVSGNYPTLIRFLLELHKKYNPKKVQKYTDDGLDVNVNRLQNLQSFSQAQTFFQMVVMILSQNLSLTPKQTLSTLAQNAKFYAHMIVKGIKNSYSEIINMLHLLNKQIPQLIYLAQRNPQKNYEFFMDLIKPTLISREADVAKAGAQLFKSYIGQTLKYNGKNLVYQILCKQQIGFDFLYMGLKRHPDLAVEFTDSIFLLVKQSFLDFFEIHLKRTINNEQQYIKIVIRMFSGIKMNQEAKKCLKNSGLLNLWLKTTQESFGNLKNKQGTLINQETKLLYLQLLCELWKAYSQQFDQDEAEQLLMKAVEQLKKNTRSSIYTIKVPALVKLFDFLHFLADKKSPLAPIIYKKLIFLFIQNHHQQLMRQVMLENFVAMLQKYPNIPVDMFLQPFLKQLITSQGKTYILNIFDFEFMVEACRHPKMQTDLALSFLQYLSKVYIKAFIYSKLVFRVIQVLTNRFCQEQTIVQFLKKNLDSTLNLYGVLILNKKKMSKQDSIYNKQKKSLAIQLVKHYVQLQHKELSQYALKKVTTIYINWLEEKHYLDKGLRYLINLYGDVDQICMQFKINQNQQVRYTQQNSRAVTSELSMSPTPSTNRHRQLQIIRQKGIGYKQKKQFSENTTQLQHLAQKYSKPNPKVLQDIEKIKNKMKGDIQKKKQQEQLELRRLNQKRDQNSLQLLQRNLSLGYSKLPPLQEGKIIFDFDSVKQKHLKCTTKFHLLSQLQIMDQRSAQIIIKTYSKQIKLLFQKYSLMSSTTAVHRDSDIDLMSFTQILKMIKEKNIPNTEKLVIADLVSSINVNRRQKNVLSGVYETDFQEFLIKLTDYNIQYTSNSRQVPFGISLQNIIKKLLKGQNFYQNKFRYKQDPKITKLKEVLNTSANQQTLQIPQGYKKSNQNYVDMQYQVRNNSWDVNPKFLIGYELTDWLLQKCLGIHIMTPLSSIKQRVTLIQIPQPIKPRLLHKQQTDPKIKYQPAEKSMQLAPKDAQSNNSDKIVKKQIQKRATSFKGINKTKTDPIQASIQEKSKLAKRQKYLAQLKVTLQQQRKQQEAKVQAEKAKNKQKKQLQQKKEQQRKKYLQQNKRKIKQRELQQQHQKQEKDKQQKNNKKLAKQQLKKDGQSFLDKQMQKIRLVAQKRQQKNKQFQQSKQKETQNYKKLAKEVRQHKNDGKEKEKMNAIKQSLANGQLAAVVKQYEKPLTELFQSYWQWEKKRIELHNFALMLKQLKISPQFIVPKTVSEVYKGITKGQPLDYENFVQCLSKCAYKSQKLNQQSSQQESVNSQVLTSLFEKMHMNDPYFKDKLKEVRGVIK